MSSTTAASLEPLFNLLSSTLLTLERTFNAIPGSAVISRYVKSSHQNDPGRTVLEVILILFALVTLFQSRTRGDVSGKHFIKFSKKEIDELVDEWQPEPLLVPLDEEEDAQLAAVPVIQGPSGPRLQLLNTGQTVVNLAGFNFTGLAGNEQIEQRAVEALRKYGLGSCGPPGFYGTIDVHLNLERDIATFLGTEAAIIYSQGFATISSVIPAFCKRGDIIVADSAVNFTIHKGIEISRSTVKWYKHNDMKSLEEVLQAVERERRKRKDRLTRRFIITEGVFENDGAIPNLPKLIELKNKYKYRLVVDETFSFGTLGANGRGLTEFFNVPAREVDMLVGSLANGLCAAGGFCAGPRVVCDHQRINGTSFVFSAAMPALLAVSASEAISILTKSPCRLETLHENIRAARSILDPLDCIYIPSHPSSAIIHILVRDKPSLDSLTPAKTHIGNGFGKHLAASDLPRVASDVEVERVLQKVVDDVQLRGVLITRARRLKGQESFEPRPSIRLAISAALTRAEVEQAVGVVRDVLAKNLVSH